MSAPRLFKLYFTGSPDQIYSKLSRAQLQLLDSMLDMINTLNTCKDTITALDILDSAKHACLLKKDNTDSLIYNCLSKLVNLEQQKEYERIGLIELLPDHDIYNSFKLPAGLQMDKLPLYIQDWLSYEIEFVSKMKPLCSVADDFGYQPRPNIKLNMEWLPEQIFTGHRCCATIKDIRPGFQNVTYDTGCCEWCRQYIKGIQLSLNGKLYAYNCSYNANYNPLTLEKETDPVKPIDIKTLFASGNNYNTLPPIIRHYLDSSAEKINCKCKADERYEYDTHDCIKWSGKTIISPENAVFCTKLYHYNAYNDGDDAEILCSICESGWNKARVNLYEIIREYNALLDKLSPDMLYKFIKITVEYYLLLQ